MPGDVFQRFDFKVEVGEVAPPGQRHEIAVRLVTPTTAADPSASFAERPLLCCLPGGFLGRRYFDMTLPDEKDDPDRYSFAVAMARAGYATVAFDHLGTGDSSRPDPIEVGYEIGLEDIARINAKALERCLETLAASDPPIDVHGWRGRAAASIRTIGVGHSMGSMLTVEQQALDARHSALVLFTFSTRGTPAFLDENMRAYAHDPARLRWEIGSLAARTMGSPYPAHAGNVAAEHANETNRRAAFGVGTAPAEAEDALHGAATNLLAVGGLASMIPDGFAPPAEKIDVPALVFVGDHDLHDERNCRADLPNAPRVDTRTIADCWHCHFVSNSRATIWEEVTRWIESNFTRHPSD